MGERFDVCVIGGGAAGMSAAIAAAEQGCKVCIIDRNKKMGKKLYATGNGRCNLANAAMDFAHYHSSSILYDSFLDECLGKNPNETLFDFLHNLGIYERCTEGYFYPRSMQASAVVWAFLDRIRKLPIELRTLDTVTKILPKEDGYLILGKSEIQASNVILACGGKSYPALGGCDCGYKLVEKLHIMQEKLRPALCGMETEEETEDIKGVRVSCAAGIKGEETQSVQRGELQITEYGLSGIMMFNLASRIGMKLQNHEKVIVHLDLFEDISKKAFVTNAQIRRTVYGYLNAYIPDKLALYILNMLHLDPKQDVNELTKQELDTLYETCRCVPFHIRSLRTYDAAQVTAGGICLEEVDPVTMECKAHPGLYITGEMLDIDGDCGGYNLTFAILTGLRAGRACHVKD